MPGAADAEAVLVALQVHPYHGSMDDKEQQKRAAEPLVPDKQIHRWKDDGGPVIDQPDDEPEQGVSDKD